MIFLLSLGIFAFHLIYLRILISMEKNLREVLRIGRLYRIIALKKVKQERLESWKQHQDKIRQKYS